MANIGKKTEAANAYLMNNSKEGGGGRKMKKMGVKKGGGGSTPTSSRKDWAEFCGCIKWVSNYQSLQWQPLENFRPPFSP